MPRRSCSPAFLAAVLAGLLHVTIFLLFYWPLSSTGYSDFAIFYTAGKILNEGNAPRLYDLSVQWQVQRTLNVPIREGPLVFNHAPLEALLFGPIARLRMPVAFAIWCLVNVGLLAAIGFTIRKRLSGFLPHWSTLTIVGMAAFPSFLTLVQGQDSFLLALIYAVVFISLEGGKDWLAGMCLALGTFKPQLVLPFVAIMFIRRQWRFVGGFAIAAGVLTVVSAVMMGLPALFGYVRFLVDFARMPYEISAAPPGNMPNIRGLVLTLFPAMGGMTSFFVVAAVSLVSVVVAALAWTDDLEIGFVLSAIVTLLCSYHLYPYDVTLLLAPALVLLSRMHKRTFTSKRLAVVIKIAIVTWCLPALGIVAMAKLKASLFSLLLFAMAAALVIEHSTSCKMVYEPATADK